MPRRKRAKKEARQKFIHLVDPRSSDSSDDNDSNVGFNGRLVEPLSKNSPKNDSGIEAQDVVEDVVDHPCTQPSMHPTIAPDADDDIHEGDFGAGDFASISSTPIGAPSRWKEPGRFSLKAWIAAKKELGLPLTGKRRTTGFLGQISRPIIFILLFVRVP